MAAFGGYLLFGLWVGPTNADEPEAVDFEKQILPLLTRRCGDCHGPEEPESGLRIDRRVSLLRGGDLGLPAIVPGKPEQSLLLEAVRGEDADFRMPPEGELLLADEIALLTRWVAEGAVWPGQMEEVVDDAASDHWSFRPVVRPELPADRTGWARNPLDQFIVQKLQARGLTPSPRADRRTLIRRLSLVLTGLPPTPEEIRDFVEDEADFETAYSDVVERLLGSPRYGERWAQHWLDVIRWAETVGFETNAPRPNAWHFRDWVIESLNKDKPYDRFLFEQLAGDSVGQEAALGFLVAGPANLPGQIGRDEEAMRQARQDELDEVIRTVSQAATITSSIRSRNAITTRCRPSLRG